MKRALPAILMVSVLLPAGAAHADAQTAEAIASIAAKTENALVAVSGKMITESGDVPVTGLGVCIDASGVFLSSAFNTRMETDTLKEFYVALPGAENKPVPTEVLGIDPETGLGFLRALEDHDWQAVTFVRTADLSIGQPVISAGLFNAPGRPRVYGVGYVSSVLRTPQKVVYVSGGSLTIPGSPVFTADGMAVGIVAGQPPLRYEISTGRISNIVALSAKEQTHFFTAIDEFAHVLEQVPTPGRQRQLPWIGVLEFAPVTELVARTNKLDRPAVKLEQIVPDGPAERAGLNNGDIIVELNGKGLTGLATPELTAEQFLRELMRLRVGQTVTLTVHTMQRQRQVNVELEAMPSRPRDAERYANRELGFIVREKVKLDDFLSPATSGVPGLIVVVVADDSPADNAGLQAGDLLTNIGGQKVRTVAAFQELIETSLSERPGQPITIAKQVGDDSKVVPIYPPTE
jgi:S1-C subfamily serine protease